MKEEGERTIKDSIGAFRYFFHVEKTQLKLQPNQMRRFTQLPARLTGGSSLSLLSSRFTPLAIFCSSVGVSEGGGETAEAPSARSFKAAASVPRKRGCRRSPKKHQQQHRIRRAEALRLLDLVDPLTLETSGSLGELSGKEEAAKAKESHAEPLSGTPPREPSDVDTYSNDDLRHVVSITFMQEKLKSALEGCKGYLEAWMRIPANKSLDRWRKQLSVVVVEGSFDKYHSLLFVFRQRISAPQNVEERSAAFRLLYILLLVNYGMFCLEKLEFLRAASLLEESLDCAVKLEDALSHGASSEGLPAQFSAEGSLLYVRAILAKSYVCLYQPWKAAQHYNEISRVLDVHPLQRFPQIAPGVPLVTRALVTEFLQEEHQLFLLDAEAVALARQQGLAEQLVLESKGAAGAAAGSEDSDALLRVKLDLARFHRYTGDWKTSQALYEAYLDFLVETGREDEQLVMLELGRMLMFDAKKVSAGLVYTTTAAEILLEDAEEAIECAMSSTQEKKMSAAAKEKVLRAASALVDVSVGHRQQEENGSAVDLLERAIALLSRGGCASYSAWVLKQCADILGAAHQVDKALDYYQRAIRVLEESVPVSGESTLVDKTEESLEPGVQLGERQTFCTFTKNRVMLHMAHCCQAYVGDYKRALDIYETVFSSLLRPPSTGGHRRRSSTSASSSPLSGRRRGRRRAGMSVSLSMSPDDVIWGLHNYVSCCERVEDWSTASMVQEKVINLEKALEMDVMPSYLKLIRLHSKRNDHAALVGIYLNLIQSMDDASADSATMLQLVYGLAVSCYSVDNTLVQTLLMHFVQRTTGHLDPLVQATYAHGLSLTDNEEKDTLSSVIDVEYNVAALSKIFKRAAQTLVAEEALLSSSSSSNNSGSSGGLADTGDEDACFSAIARSIKRDLSAVVIFNSGAFFFQSNNLNAEAEELYTMAMELRARAAPASLLDKEYRASSAVLLTNYAVFLTFSDPPRAEALLREAVELAPENMAILDAQSSFHILHNDFAKAIPLLKHQLTLQEDSLSVLDSLVYAYKHCWDTLSPEERMAVLFYMLRSMVVNVETLPVFDTPTTSANFEERVNVMGKVFLMHARYCVRADAMCQVSFVLASFFGNLRFSYQFLRIALRRFPDRAVLHVNYAKLWLDKKNYLMVRRHYARALALSPDSWAHANPYSSFLMSESLRQNVAAENLNRYLVNNCQPSQHANCLYHYAALLSVAFPTPHRTEKYFKRALDADPTNLGLLHNYAAFVWASADSREALSSEECQTRTLDRVESLYRKAVKHHPNSALAWKELGCFFSHRPGMFSDSLSALQKAHQLDPRDASIVQALGDLLVEEATRRHHEENQEFASNERVTNSSRELRELIGAAETFLDRALEMDPKDTKTLNTYANFAAKVMQNASLAAELFKRLQKLM